MAVIAMTREMGSLGREVARLAAQRLGIDVVHHEVIEGPAERRAGAPASEVGRFLDGSGPAGARGYLTQAEVLALALAGNVLIRGWGASRLLHDIPHVLTVRICAPMERRVAEMCRRLGVDEAQARREIERNDAAHARSVLPFFVVDWQNPQNYDMVLNTGHLPVACCAEVIAAAATSAALAETPQSRRMLEDRLLEARIAETLHGPGPLQRRAAHVEGTAERGDVRLYGVVTDGSAAAEIERSVHGLPGVGGVRNEIVRVGPFSDH